MSEAEILARCLRVLLENGWFIIQPYCDAWMVPPIPTPKPDTLGLYGLTAQGLAR